MRPAQISGIPWKGPREEYVDPHVQVAVVPTTQERLAVEELRELVRAQLAPQAASQSAGESALATYPPEVADWLRPLQPQRRAELLAMHGRLC